MQMNKTGKAWRVVAIILVGMTAAMNLLGGIGTTCAAFFTQNFPPMLALVDFQWLYQLFVVATVLVGLAGIWSLVRLLRGGAKAYQSAVIILGIGAGINILHVIVSTNLRGKAAPADVVMAINVVSLLVLLYLGTPGMRKRVGFDQPANRNEMSAAGGAAAIVCGLITLTTPLWAGPTHLFEGQNWVDLLIAPLLLAGTALLALGVSRVGRLAWEARQAQGEQSEPVESPLVM